MTRDDDDDLQAELADTNALVIRLRADALAETNAYRDLVADLKSDLDVAYDETLRLQAENKVLRARLESLLKSFR